MGDIFSTDIVGMILKCLPIIIPILAGIAISVIGRLWRDDDKDILILFAAGSLIVSILLFWRLWMASAAPRFDIALEIIVLFFALFFVLSLSGYYQQRHMDIAPFAASFLYGMSGIVMALVVPNLDVTFFGIAISSMACTLLIKTYGGDGGGEVAWKFWIYSVACDILFCLGVVFFFGATGSFRIGSSAELIAMINKFHTGNFFRISIAVMATALFAKMAVVPMHWWLGDVVNIRSIPLVNGIVIFYRVAMMLITLKIFAPIVNVWGGFFETPLVVVALVTMCWANLMALMADDLKKLAAYSATAHIGYILSLFPVMMLGTQGTVSVILLTVSMGISHMGLFASLQTVSTDEADYTDFASLEGLAKRRPWTAVTMSLFLMGMACLPPLLGFLAKFMALREMVLSGSYFVLVVFALNVVVAFCYCSRPITLFFLKKPADLPKPGFEVAYPLIVAIILAAVIVIYLGILPSSFLNWLGMSAAVL